MIEKRDAARAWPAVIALVVTLSGCAVNLPTPEEPAPVAPQVHQPAVETASVPSVQAPFENKGTPKETVAPAAEPWTLIWQDEFDGPEIDRSKWTHVVGGGGYGNNELQYYTDEKENSFIENGCLVIEAVKKERQNHAYTSAKLHTQNKGDWTYGRFELRAKVPRGNGYWPALWMMPTDYAKYGPWPSCGEIDLMEAIGRDPGAVFGTLHYGNPWKNAGGNYRLPGAAPFTDEFHVFALEWSPGKFEWFVDGKSYAVQSEWYTSAPGAMWPAPFDRDFYFQINLAVGGNWPGAPDASTPFPGRLFVDYFRVYKFNGTYPPVEKRLAAPAELRPRDPMPDGNLIYNGGFDDGMKEWTLDVSSPAQAEATADSGELRAKVMSAGTEPWHAQILQKPLHVELGRSYEVAFEALSDPPRSINVKVGKASQHWDNYSGDQPVELGATRARHRFVFKMRHSTDPVARVEFQLGATRSFVVLDNVSIKPVQEDVAFRVDKELRIEAEQFDAAQGVNTEPSSDGGLNVGWIEEGDWLDYNLDVAKSATYVLRVRYANGGKTTGRMAVLVDQEVPASVDLPITGDWQKWSTAQCMFNMSAGPHKLRLLCKQRGYNLNWLELVPR